MPIKRPTTLEEAREMIEYKQVGDYLLPTFDISDEDKKPLGRWGMKRNKFLKTYKNGVFHEVWKLTGTLTPHLHEVDKRAEEMYDILMEQMKKAEGVTEDLKRKEQMKWVGMMNSIAHRVEEIVLNDIIYEEITSL